MKILISGAGIAGLTAAYWLNKDGHEIQVIEKSKNLRDEGYMMDFFGPGYDVAEKMGIVDALNEKNHWIDHFHFVNQKGNISSSFRYPKLFKLVDANYSLLMRGELVNVLYEHVKNKVQIRYGLSVTHIENTPSSALVSFSDKTQDRFDMVIGADGIHSKVRELVFGQEKEFIKPMGFHIASFILNRDLPLPAGENAFYATSVPNKQAIIYPIAEQKFAPFFAWNSKEMPDTNPQNHHEIVKGLFKSMNWIVPEVVNTIDTNTKLYFDSVSQIVMDNWHKGRVVLIGDACACLSLLAGQGSSFAMAGAYILAHSLREEKENYKQAFSKYQSMLQPIIKQKQVNAAKFANTFVPKNRFSIILRDLFIKIMFWPGIKQFTKKQLGGTENDIIKKL